jgi:ABC-type phosphate transport system permease subunit
MEGTKNLQGAGRKSGVYELLRRHRRRLVEQRLVLLARRGVHFLVSLVMSAVFLVICRETWIYSKTGQFKKAGQQLLGLVAKHSFLDVFLGLGSIVFLLWSLRWVAENSFVILFAKGWKARRRYEYAMRLVGALPTAVLGSSIVVTLSKLGLYPKSNLAQYFLALFIILFISLPTVMQVGVGLLKDYDGSAIAGYIALGAKVDKTARVFVIPSMRSTINTAVMVSSSRVVIEAYLVTRFASGISAIKDDAGFLDLFRTIYSSVTVKDNVLLIFVLFLVALFVSVSFVSVPMSQRPAP